MITLAHGEGGWLMRQLLHQTVGAQLGNSVLDEWGDAARIEFNQSRIAFTTDSYVVTPMFFPGGDIGQLAVYGTVNDLVVSGATPRWISLALIIEEGLPMEVFERVLESIANAARMADVQVVTGDTKVVPHGAADQLFINTSGIGELLPNAPPGPSRLSAGDILLVSGPLGRHGIAVLNARENLGLMPPPMSDCTSLAPIANALQKADISVRAMRDATRGGLAAVLHEWAETSGLTLSIVESALPITSEVRGACELLGLDAVHVANEGVLVLAVPEHLSEQALRTMQSTSIGQHAAIVGIVEPRKSSAVIVERGIGRIQPLDLPSGAHLPRIC